MTKQKQQSWIGLMTAKDLTSTITDIYQYLWSTDSDTDTLTLIIIWENEIIKYNHMCQCRVGVGHDTYPTLGHA